MAQQSRENWPHKQVSPDDLEKIISGDPKLLVDKAHEIAGAIRNVSTSQVRNAFGTMKKLQMWGWEDEKTRHKLLLLKPRLAYMAARQKGNQYKLFCDVLCKSIDNVGDNPKAFENFCDFFEAILAYHKARGGKS